MASIVNSFFKPELEKEIFVPIEERILSLLRPIQSYDVAKDIGYICYSDVKSFLFRPVIDLLLIPALLLDATISLLNTICSLAKAAYLWTMNQKLSEQSLDSDTKKELKEARIYFKQTISSLLSIVLNPLLSTCALITRPMVSAEQFIREKFSEESNSPKI